MSRTTYTPFTIYVTAYIKHYDLIEYDALQCDI